ncbi:hypothetical protein ACQKCJ_03380 [Flavobacterium sp. NPDC079362]|uniref:hypothetical protein n=1 Tax=Flavobacterium sp. NPDC079362 TaxID=3390566 RepID=UPI003CFE42E6
MKKIGIAVILMLIFISCSNEKAKSPMVSDYHGKWELIEVTGFRPANIIFDKLGWQESYVFNTDETFIKTRTKDNKTTTATGKFAVKKLDNETHFELTYEENNDIIGTCTGNLIEDLSINKEGLLVNSWQMCDGPGLIYKKSK